MLKQENPRESVGFLCYSEVFKLEIMKNSG